MPESSKVIETVIVSPGYSSTAAAVVISSGAGFSGGEDAPSERDLESAVFSYLQSVRALGRTSINSTEIADTLSISLADVHRVIASLGDRGVRVVG